MHNHKITSKLPGLGLLAIAMLTQPLMASEILDAASGAQGFDSSTIATSFTDVTTDVDGLTAMIAGINLQNPGKVLVMSTYSMNYDTNGPTRSGSWQLSDGTSNSVAVSRYMSSTGDSGIGMSVGLFDYASAPGTVNYALQHATSASGKAINTTNASIVAIPMVSQNGLTLNSSQATQVAEVITSSSTFSSVATGSIDLTYGGHVFLSTAFSTHVNGKSKADRVGEWQLQLETSTDVWANVGNISQRFMTSTSDTGAAMLMGIYDADDLDSGTYNYRLMMRSSADGDGVGASAITVTAMGFSFSEDLELPHWQTSTPSDTTTSTTLEPVTGTETAISTVIEGKLFLGASFSANVDGAGSIDPALYNLKVDTLESEILERTVATMGDFAAGGAVTLTDPLAPDDYIASLQHATSVDGGTLDTLNPNLVAFAMAVEAPEPATMSLLALGGIAMLRRRKR
jgi:energy-coupling factor transporter transmembrane protein EcfT